MQNIGENLASCTLFENFTATEIVNILSNTKYKINKYKKSETIALEGDPISSIGIILLGNIEIQKVYPSGKIVTINRMGRGNIFGEAIKKTYPSTIVSSGDSEILFISEEDIIKLCSSSKVFLNNFMRVLSNRILNLSKILRNLSYQTIREKIASYLLDEYKKQHSLTINMNLSRQEMADLFGITRPSLSRELINMKNDNLIHIDKKAITIIDIEALEEILL